MLNKKKMITMLAISAAAMCMMNGCQKKAAETEVQQSETLTAESQTEAQVKNYTSENGSFSMDLPDAGWVATKEGIENKWAFMKEGAGTISITHKRSKIKAKKLPQSQEDAIALLNQIKENGFSEVEYKKDSANGMDLYYYAASVQGTDLGYAYLAKYLINTENESYTITAKLMQNDSASVQSIKTAVTSFLVLKDDSKKAESETEQKADNSNTESNTSNENAADGNETDTGAASAEEEYRYFFDEAGNTIYTYPSEDGRWRDKNGKAYIFLENGVEDADGTKYYYDPPQVRNENAESNESTGDDIAYIDFYDRNGNYVKATQDANGNWVGDDGKTYTFDEKGATDSEGNFNAW